jgi:hypothetical protein
MQFLSVSDWYGGESSSNFPFNVGGDSVHDHTIFALKIDSNFLGFNITFSCKVCIFKICVSTFKDSDSFIFNAERF